MKPIEVADGVYDVGVNDWNIEDFHGYSTPLGTSYNAYLVMDEKITLIDTVKNEFADQLIANISEIVDPKKIDYVVSNHTEMDHSGGLARVMHRLRNRGMVVPQKPSRGGCPGCCPSDRGLEELEQSHG